MASTCRDLWSILEDEIYIADVLDVKRRASAWQSDNRCEPLPYLDNDETVQIVGAPRIRNAILHEESPRDTAHGTNISSTGAQTAEAETETSPNQPTGTEAADATNPISSHSNSSSTQRTGPVPRPMGRFPAESSATWIEMLQEDNPQGGLHTLASKGPVSSARKLIATAERFWPKYIDFSGLYGESPIQLAAWHGQREVAELLLDSGCTARAASNYVCWDPRPLDQIINHITERSTGAGADSARLRLNPSRGDHGLSETDRPFVTDALGFAILGGHEDIVKLLLERCYNRGLVRSMSNRWKDSEGFTVVSPLHLAALGGMAWVVEALIARGANPNGRERCFHNCSPLHMASTREGNKEAIQMLLDLGADVHRVDDQSRTVTQWAESFGNEDLSAWYKEMGVGRATTT